MANELKFRITGIEEATGALRGAILQGAQNGLEKVGLRGEMLVTLHTPVGATGNLKGGVFSQLHIDGPAMHEVISVGPPADVYAAAVELGTKPHMPPSSALLLWVKQVLHVNDEKQAKSIAFLVARAISKRGTKAVGMFDKAWEQLQQEAPGILEAAIATEIQKAGFKS